MQTSHLKSERSLALILKGLISIQEGLQSDEEVTLEYMREKRKAEIYPKTRYVIGSGYGGYSTDGLKVMSFNDYDKLKKALDEAMASL